MAAPAPPPRPTHASARGELAFRGRQHNAFLFPSPRRPVLSPTLHCTPPGPARFCLLPLREAVPQAGLRVSGPPAKQRATVFPRVCLRHPEPPPLGPPPCSPGGARTEPKATLPTFLSLTAQPQGQAAGRGPVLPGQGPPSGGPAGGSLRAGVGGGRGEPHHHSSWGVRDPLGQQEGHTLLAGLGVVGLLMHLLVCCF